MKWLRFRFHFLPPLLSATLATGEPLGMLATGFAFLPMIALCTEWGPWAHPVNFIFSVFVFLATPALEVAKRVSSECEVHFRVTQLSLWWLYWALVSLALVSGTYRGP
ncbi:MAG: hypothetical protein AAFU85_29100 [Planctomycetota bacterium]